ncbi:MAG: sigma-70 family RNA polymerase sigma factor [Pseudomonadales bacterium]
MLKRFFLSQTLAKGVANDLKAYAYTVCSDHHLAEDLSQEVIAKVLESKRAPRSAEELKPYTFKMLRNLYIDYVRKQQLRVQYAQVEQQLYEKYQLSGTELLDEFMLNQAFASLNETQRELVYMVDVLGYKYREVAAITGMQLGTVMSRLSRARAQMVAHLQEGECE